jgi:hypothetical protein
MTAEPVPIRAALDPADADGDARLADDRRAALDVAVQRALGKYADRSVIDVPELAELMNWSRSTAYDAVRQGVVPSITVNRRVVVPVPGLVALLLGVDP